MTWYAFGEIVLDRLVGVSRAESINVHLLSDDVLVSDIRDSLGIQSNQTLLLRNTEPRRICSLDETVLLPSGALVDRDSDTEVRAAGLVECRTAQTELTDEDVVRLYRWMRRYPEIAFEQALRRRVSADFAHLLSVAARRPDVELLLFSELPKIQV